MLRKVTQDAVMLTGEIMQAYWGGDIQALIDHLDANARCIGPSEEEYFVGKDSVSRRIEFTAHEHPKCTLGDQVYEPVYSDGKSVVVMGRYRCYDEEGYKPLYSQKQTITLLWSWDKTLKIRLIFFTSKGDILFETGGEEKISHEPALLKERDTDSVFIVKDVNHVTHVLTYSELVALKAERNYTYVYPRQAGCCWKIRGNISAISDKLPNYFVRVNRSCVVNKRYIESIHGREVTLINGLTCRLPGARVAEVRRMLTAINDK